MDDELNDDIDEDDVMPWDDDDDEDDEDVDLEWSIFWSSVDRGDDDDDNADDKADVDEQGDDDEDEDGEYCCCCCFCFLDFFKMLALKLSGCSFSLGFVWFWKKSDSFGVSDSLLEWDCESGFVSLLKLIELRGFGIGLVDFKKENEKKKDI